MSFQHVSIAGQPALVADPEGPVLRTEDDARDVIQETFGSGIQLAVIPVERLDPDFFVLRTGVAGAFVQKLVQYRLRLVVVGDISAQVAGSDALGDWVREVNRGRDILFVPDLPALEARLNAEGPGS
jgi:Domain of unknown function (DUF4180)